jgi:hypothetical protein
LTYNESIKNPDHKNSPERFKQYTWGGEGAFRIIHWILGSIVLILGLVNICLGVFLAVLPLAVWVVWYVYFSILVVIIILMEILQCVRRRGTGKGGSFKLQGKII